MITQLKCGLVLSVMALSTLQLARSQATAPSPVTATTTVTNSTATPLKTTSNVVNSTSTAGAISIGDPVLHVNGHAAQARDKGGFVKAMAYINPFLSADQYIVRCYNSQLTGDAASMSPCGITVTRFATGAYFIDFGFKVDDRFISVQPVMDVAIRLAAVKRNDSVGAQVRVDVFDQFQNYEDGTFYIFVY